MNMAGKVSKNTMLIFTIIAVIISVCSITLNFIALNKYSVSSAEGQDYINNGPGGKISLKVLPLQSEMGSQVKVSVENGQ